MITDLIVTWVPVLVRLLGGILVVGAGFGSARGAPRPAVPPRQGRRLLEVVGFTGPWPTGCFPPP
jgi:hypothetical protein